MSAPLPTLPRLSSRRAPRPIPTFSQTPAFQSCRTPVAIVGAARQASDPLGGFPGRWRRHALPAEFLHTGADRGKVVSSAGAGHVSSCGHRRARVSAERREGGAKVQRERRASAIKVGPHRHVNCVWRPACWRSPRLLRNSVVGRRARRVGLRSAFADARRASSRWAPAFERQPQRGGYLDVTVRLLDQREALAHHLRRLAAIPRAQYDWQLRASLP
jgi:hypothetical protein